MRILGDLPPESSTSLDMNAGPRNGEETTLFYGHGLWFVLVTSSPCPSAVSGPMAGLPVTK